MRDWGRLLTAIVTPFSSDGQSVNHAEMARIANHLVDSGSSGIVVAGTTGESPTLTHEEKLAAFRTVREAVGQRAAIVAGTGSNSTEQSIELTLEAEEMGLDGAMLVAPYYNKPSQEGLFRHFQAVASRTKLPVLIYNIPSRTSVNVEPSTILRLMEACPNVIAVKEASGNIGQISDLCAALPEGRRVYSGDDALTLPVLAVGGYGVVSVMAHVAGRAIREMIEAYVSGNTGEALRLHRATAPLCKALFCTTSPTPVKEAVGMLGYDVGPVRLPLVPLNSEQRSLVREAMVAAGVL
ncbi:MAG: 4-hydroxy-tetrahydrodipicolinate synthase 2 [Fimbriimonadales bacterium]